MKDEFESFIEGFIKNSDLKNTIRQLIYNAVMSGEEFDELEERVGALEIRIKKIEEGSDKY